VRWRKLRPAVQVVALLLFVVLMLAAGRGVLPADLFFRIDPLAGLAGMLAGRRLIPALLAGALIVLAGTLLLGRAWCGWLCPLGTLLDWTPARQARPKDAELAPAWRSVKYFLLAFILVSALFGSLTFLVLDPLTLLYRTFATVLWPAFNALLLAAEHALYWLPFLQAPIDALESTRGAWLPLEPPVYAGAVLAALLFAGVLALNAVRPRFWCRYLCPLGGMLGLVSRFAWLRRTVSSECVACQRCVRACPTGTIDPARGYASDPAECTMCLDCLPACARGGQTFIGHLRPAPRQPYDLSRRRFLGAAAAAIAAIGVFAVEPAARRAQARLIRPPGAQSPQFAAQCIRCGLCIKACPTSGLQLSLSEGGTGATWTPVLVPRLGYCDYTCNACGQVCPTGAIPPLALAEKRQAVMGHAYIDRSRCLPWADNITCLVCEEMCPLPDKAIKLEDITVAGLDGTPIAVRRPHVQHDRCVGCGICENRCPLAGESAIRVASATDWLTVPG